MQIPHGREQNSPTYLEIGSCGYPEMTAKRLVQEGFEEARANSGRGGKAGF
jgi:hypothetical protein